MLTIRTLHFVGIGGAGMSGIAEVLLNLGYRITGSDQQESAVTQRLRDLGATVFIGHDASHVTDADAVVVSSAIHEGNPEIQAARARSIPIVPRAMMLAELMRLRQGIAIAGAHGKTTTTSLTTSLLAQGGLDPTFVIGGKLNSAGANARLGTGPYLVAEADESDASFLWLSPVLSVVTNIDVDHMSTYHHDFNELKAAFVQFLERLPFYGRAVLCWDCEHVRSIADKLTKPIIRYGFHEEAHVRAIDVRQGGAKMSFTVLRQNREPLPIELNLPGRHNVQNALAAIAVATLLGVSDEAIQEACRTFTGVGRRFTRYGDIRGLHGQVFEVIDDYGHHPNEMRPTWEALKGAFPDKEKWVLFQPHRYTRTHDAFDDFVTVLSSMDRVTLAPVYSAGETPIEGATTEALAEAIYQKTGRRPEVVSVSEMPSFIRTHAPDGGVVLTMGAGDIGRVAPQLSAFKVT